MPSRKAQAKDAANTLREGGLVVFPTDTVIGVGAALSRPAAIQRLYSLKHRPPDQATALLISSIDQIQFLSRTKPEPPVSDLLLAFWPGDLTVVLPRLSPSPFEDGLALVCGTENKVGLRLPDHALTIEIIQMLGCPLVATSANFRGQPPPSSFEHLDPAFAAETDLVVRSEAAKTGVASTVIDLSTEPFTLLRQGDITTEDLNRVLRPGLRFE